jgi:signal transduction histidine kinase
MRQPLDDKRLRRLMEVGPSLIAELDPDTVLYRLLEVARDVTGARYAALGVRDPDGQDLERFVTQGLTDEEERAIGERPRGRGILGVLISDPRSLRLRELKVHPASYGFPANHPPMSSFLGVPVMIGGAAWGNLYLTDKRDGEFTAEDEEAAEILASWAAIAIEQARLMTAASARQDELERVLRGLEATQAIAVAVGAETDLPRVLELIAKRALAIVDARGVLILLQDGNSLVVAAGAGHTRPDPDARIPIEQSTSGQVMVSQRSARITDVSQLQVPVSRLGVPDARSALLVPLIYRGRSLGVLAAFDRAQRSEFSEDDEQVLVSFAASAATAVATAQTVQAERLRNTLEAAEAERRHWARELHDETLQTLGGLKLLASGARRLRDPDQITEALDRLVAGLEAGIENLHAIISELRPAALDDLGLRPAIETLASWHQISHGFEVELNLQLPDPVRGDRRLAPEIETTVYRLIQEALTNVAKHAHARTVLVTAAISGNHIRIEVSDDGAGFETDAVTAGFGLTGMRERAALVGGVLELSSSPTGTTVTAVVPSGWSAEGS